MAIFLGKRIEMDQKHCLNDYLVEQHCWCLAVRRWCFRHLWRYLWEAMILFFISKNLINSPEDACSPNSPEDARSPNVNMIGPVARM
jgi:hypothetical protein